ncbi:MAG: hypothetical protein HY873_03130 [Chloroflexi bacterium]|nr:hypothetical protein [Chloroflexota bacterium]
MEAFEHIVKVFVEGEGYAVTTNLKFPVRRKTRKTTYDEWQEHGYEVDIVGARGDQLLLGSVKSYLGSYGVSTQGFKGLADEARATHFGQYAMFNELDIQQGIINGAAKRFRFNTDAIHLALFVGRFGPGQEKPVRAHLQVQGIRVVGLVEIVAGIKRLAESKTYFDDPVLMTMKCVAEVEALRRKSASRRER